MVGGDNRFHCQSVITLFLALDHGLSGILVTTGRRRPMAAIGDRQLYDHQFNKLKI